MKRFGLGFVGLALLAAFSSCAGSAPVQQEATGFADVEGRTWILHELRTGGEILTIDLEAFAEAGFSQVFTLTFDGAESRVSGVAAPNRFTGPYTLDDEGALSIGSVEGALAATRMATTLAAPLVEIDGLTEHQFFALLSATSRWELANEGLILYTAAEDGSEAVLVFVQG